MTHATTAGNGNSGVFPNSGYDQRYVPATMHVQHDVPATHALGQQAEQMLVNNSHMTSNGYSYSPNPSGIIAPKIMNNY